jgi:hypothetical protein
MVNSLKRDKKEEKKILIFKLTDRKYRRKRNRNGGKK